MSHIAEGTDHLLFLGTLLLVAPLLPIRSRVGWRWRDGRDLRSTLRRTALIVTAFTVGHAVSLALVSFGRVTLPITPVEVLVAASIIAAAIHAVKPVVPRGEIAIAALFGLVHGSAFATTILDLQLATAATASAVLGFNIGLELAQLVAVALALPLIVVVSRTRAYPVVRGLLAVAAAAAAVAWIVAILTGSDSVLTPFFNAIAARPVVVYGFAAALAVIVWSLAPRTDTPAVTRRRETHAHAGRENVPTVPSPNGRIPPRAPQLWP